MGLFLPEEWISESSAMHVISAINHFVVNLEDRLDLHFGLRIVNTRTGEVKQLWIRPDYTNSPFCIGLVSGNEIIRCVLRDGPKIDIVFPSRFERDLSPALILISDKTPLPESEETNAD